VRRGIGQPRRQLTFHPGDIPHGRLRLIPRSVVAKTDPGAYGNVVDATAWWLRHRHGRPAFLSRHSVRPVKLVGEAGTSIEFNLDWHPPVRAGRRPAASNQSAHPWRDSRDAGPDVQAVYMSHSEGTLLPFSIANRPAAPGESIRQASGHLHVRCGK